MRLDPVLRGSKLGQLYQLWSGFNMRRGFKKAYKSACVDQARGRAIDLKSWSSRND